MGTLLYEEEDSSLENYMRAKTGSSSPTAPSPRLQRLPRLCCWIWTWVSVGSKGLFDANGGGAVLYDESQLAVFNVVESCHGIEKVSWYATQNMGPFDHSFVLAQGMGGLDGRPKDACPMHKRSYDLSDGCCLNGDDLRLQVFEAKEEEGVVYVLLPATDVVDARLATSKFVAKEGDSAVHQRWRQLQPRWTGSAVGVEAASIL
ncbi:hypothetical protein PF011_g12963 [Phytophthora fragariae]|uniref:Rieske domain-containing protein n=2 Tax=Phytophthora fragariae TaxID=53985 RepID=A0A6A3KCF6_9STRA|nr:hypothetical protein PF011_g12963 [Phytophthora fragariae]